VGLQDADRSPTTLDDSERRVVALTVPDREAIMRALEDCPDELAELRGVLLREHAWRMEHGL
jgi:hypothetical protein